MSKLWVYPALTTRALKATVYLFSTFLRSSQLNGNFKGNIFEIKHDIENQGTALDKGSSTLSQNPHVLHPASLLDITKVTEHGSTKLCQTVGVNRGNKLP